MKICVRSHPVVIYHGKNCPFCQLMIENRRMKGIIREIKIEYILRENFARQYDFDRFEMLEKWQVAEA
jgi:hypothetical protein